MARHDSDARARAPAPPGAASASAPATVPAEILRAWDAAEARLFPLVMARPEEYQRSLTLIQALLGWLRSRCQDVPALLSESARGAAIIADAVGELTSPPGRSGPSTGRAGGIPAIEDPGAGVRGELIAAAACAMRYRELAAASAARGRLACFASASAGGGTWAVVEEVGDAARASYVPYQRVEAHVPSGRSLVISAGPDEMLRALWRLDEAELDLASGHLVIGAEIGSYTSAAELEKALARARLRPS